MVAPIRILRSQADDIAAVCAIGALRLSEVASAIEAAPVTIRRERIREIVHSVLPADQTTTLCRIVFGLSGIDSRDEKAAANIVAGVSKTLETNYKDDSRFASWPSTADSLESILSCKSVHFAAKAVDVSYDFERVLSDSRILTSVRPIYTANRDAIVGSTVVQTLRLDFIDSAGHSDTISIALDISDIKQLARICNEAQDKARVARTRLEKDWGNEVIMAGDEQLT